MLSIITYGQSGSKTSSVLNQKYQLDKPHSAKVQWYYMESKVFLFEADGRRKKPDIYRLILRIAPGPSGDTVTCKRFTFTPGNLNELSIPSLAGFSYLFSLSSGEKDEKGQLFGIDHSKFDGIQDTSGKMVPIENRYHIYNAFIDFHSMQVFSDKTSKGKGVQDLSHIGDSVVHSAAWSEPPVNLGSQIAEGSVFRNGRITLNFKGLGRVNSQPCAILGYDSGESSFHMIIKPMENMVVVTDGSSHYWGDIEKGLNDNWIQQALLHEIVVSDTKIPGNANPVRSTIERSIQISNITQSVSKQGPGYK